MSEETEMGDGFVVVDLETSGLNHNKGGDVILEAGVRVYDNHFKHVSSCQLVVVNEGWRAKLAANPYVWDMHMKSGLIPEIEYYENSFVAGSYSPKRIELQLITFLQDESLCGLKAGQHPITGSSVEFDRRFLREYMPMLEAWFHYRSIDVSTVKELCRRWNPELYAALKEQREGWEKKHRVMEDIQATVDELKFYYDHFIFAEDFENEDDPFARQLEETMRRQEPLPGL